MQVKGRRSRVLVTTPPQLARGTWTLEPMLVRHTVIGSRGCNGHDVCVSRVCLARGDVDPGAHAGAKYCNRV